MPERIVFVTGGDRSLNAAVFAEAEAEGFVQALLHEVGGEGRIGEHLLGNLALARHRSREPGSGARLVAALRPPAAGPTGRQPSAISPQPSALISC